MTEPLETAVENAETGPAVDDRALQEGVVAEDLEHVGLGETLRVLMGASRGFWLVNFVNFADGIAYFGFLTLLTLFLQHDVGFSTELSGIAVSVFTGFVTLFMALGAGALSDRLGSRRALTLSLVIALLGRVGLAFTPLAGGAPWLTVFAAASLLVMAFGEGVIQPAMYAGVKEYTDERTATMGYAFLYSIMNLGIVAGEFVSPWIREAWASRVEGLDVKVTPTAGITGAYLFYIGVTALAVLVNIVFFTKKVEREQSRIVHEETAAEPAGAASVSQTLGGLFQRLRDLPIFDKRFLFFIFVLLPVRTLFAHQWLTMPDYVTRVFPAEVGSRWEWLSGLNPFVIVIGVPLIAAVTRRRKVVDMMIVGTLISAVSTFMLVSEPRLSLLIAYIVAFSIGEAVWSSRFLEYIADIAPKNRLGVYMGIASLPWFIAKATTGWYSGFMLDRFIPVNGPQDPQSLWLIYGLIALLSPVGLLLARRWLLAGEERAREQARAAVQ